MSFINKIPTWLKIILFTIANLLLFFIIFWTLFSYPKISKIEKIEITKIENNTIHTFSKVLVNNPNYFSISGKDLKFKMKYKNSIIGNGKVNNSFILPANSSSAILSQMQFNINKLSGFWKSFIKIDSLEIDIISDGSYTFLNLSIEHEEKMYLSSSDLINILIANAFDGESIKYSNLSIEKTGLTNWIWNFDFKIKNTLPEDITIHDLKVELYADEQTNKELGIWNPNDKNIVINKNSTRTLEGSLNISFGGLLKTVFTKAKTKTTTLYVKTTIVVKLNNEKFTIPYTNYISFNPITKKIEILD